MYSIRPIQPEDNAQIANIIRRVSQEFGLAAESGFAVGDSILDELYQVYQQPKSAYWVVVDQQNKIYGGGGIAPLKGDATILEIQKMYFLPEIRKQGFAKKILELSFEFALAHQIKSVYLETTKVLWQAVKLYEKFGFQHLDHPEGNTGHSEACEIWMLKNLST
ncbi:MULTISPECIES: GNAT family N-acetyltransferase [Acinetobacter]|jgi:putative acetyltransferase|uniref:GNAT family N-acetyltransferase n=1 Tax=Acinetobacter TaxID=469 RepID=UPI0001BBA1FF|nr:MULTISPECIES: GNAT family N-acetyltransferase [Pseudomonadota]EEY89846.1 acetyltransferase, GNAT family [Acinetobacter lwoffii SH145]MRA05070.1 GNAT family N-acetyltransferase [Acinetobacter lwoffii]QPF33336.1 GNAT family N-acetyltransferase [Acinetobacter lwoffii]SPJ20131.1 Acetyltransferase (GNAT) family protein [Prolinoborus fasciculus]